VADESGVKALGFVFPEGPVLPRPERDIVEAGKKRAPAKGAAPAAPKQAEGDTADAEDGPLPHGAPDAPLHG